MLPLIIGCGLMAGRRLSGLFLVRRTDLADRMLMRAAGRGGAAGHEFAGCGAAERIGGHVDHRGIAARGALGLRPRRPVRLVSPSDPRRGRLCWRLRSRLPAAGAGPPPRGSGPRALRPAAGGPRRGGDGPGHGAVPRRVGSDGGVRVSAGDARARAGGGTTRRLHLPGADPCEHAGPGGDVRGAERARRGPVLRRARCREPGGRVRPHPRADAGGGGLRHQGRRGSASPLAPRRSRCRAFARLRDAVGSDAEDGDLRPAAGGDADRRASRLAGLDAVRDRPGVRGAGCALGAGGTRPEASAGLQQCGEYRDHPAGHGGGRAGSGARAAGDGGAGVHRGAAAQPEPRAVQESPVPGSGSGAAGDGDAANRPAGGSGRGRCRGRRPHSAWGQWQSWGCRRSTAS